MTTPAVADVAAEAAARAGVVVRSLDGLKEITAASELFAEVWDTSADTLMPVGLLRALEHAGNYASGAFDGGRMVAAGVGFYGEHDGRRHLHSHIVGVVPEVQSRQVGFAVKQHQRAWCLQRDIDEIEWTFDPLVRRNGWFNVAKLGASVAAYYPDFYGPMNDGLNAGEPSDRGLVLWQLRSPSAIAASERTLVEADHDALVAGGARVVLEEGPAGRPASGKQIGDTRLCWVPLDIVAVRQSDRGLAREWRLAVRDVFLAALDDGLTVTGMTRSGCYVLSR